MFGDSRFDLGIARQRAARADAKALGGFLLGYAIVANAVINDDARGLLRKHQPRTFRLTIASSWPSLRIMTRFLPALLRVPDRCLMRR